MKVRIVSDGTASGTYVYNEDGKDLTQTLRIISITVKVKEQVEAVLETIGIILDVQADATVVPVKKEVVAEDNADKLETAYNLIEKAARDIEEGSKIIANAIAPGKSDTK